MDSSAMLFSSFDIDRHIAFLEMMVHTLPADYQEQDINRLTLAYFAISGLDILNALHRINKDGVIDWVLSLQAHPPTKSELDNGEFYGFHGSRTFQFEADHSGVSSHNGSNLASTYCALAILKIVGYDLSSMDWESILVSMKHLQQPDGSFMPIHTGAEKDLRFVYCAAAICSMLNNWSGMDRRKAKNYIVNCQSYDGGFGLVPGLESHGGATYCAIAALRLLGFIGEDILSSSSSIIDVPLLLEWSLQRQAVDGGFQGRPNKRSDTCYAFWVGGVLKILGAYHFFDKDALRAFLLSCQTRAISSYYWNAGYIDLLGATMGLLPKPSLWMGDDFNPTISSVVLQSFEYGGFSKFPEELPDLYHSYYGFCAFSLLDEPGLKPICVNLGITDISSILR